MLLHTKGIVFKTTKYAETSVVAKIYTEKLGLQSYLINGVRTKRAKIKAALLQPLSLLDMVVYNRKNKSLKRIKELKSAYTFSSIPFDIPKSSLALFITEILYKSIKEEEENRQQFQFLHDFIQYLDQTKIISPLLHIHFLVKLSWFLGFYPYNNFSIQKNKLFDLQEGIFITHKPFHPYVLGLPTSQHLANILDISREDLIKFQLNKSYRKQLLQVLLNYYRLHVEHFGEIKSVRILEEIFG